MTTTYTNQDAKEAFPGNYPEQFGRRAAELSAAAQALALDAFLATNPQSIDLSASEIRLESPAVSTPTDVVATVPPAVPATGNDAADAARAALNNIFGGGN